MRYIKDYLENLIEIKKSKFICQVYRVNNTDEVLNILTSVRKKYYDARHNCYAYIIGDNMEIMKSSDDGEPQKTAGYPMMEALKKYEVTNILVIVTRYFGGTLLGASGLIHAYSSSVHEALGKCKFYVKKNLEEILIQTDYKGYNQIIEMPNVNIIDQKFLDYVILRVGLDGVSFDSFCETLEEMHITKEIKKIGDFQVEIPID